MFINVNSRALFFAGNFIFVNRAFFVVTRVLVSLILLNVYYLMRLIYDLFTPSARE